MTDWDGFSAQEKILLGIQNISKLFRIQNFGVLLFLTFKYVICVVILVNLTAFLLAWLLTSGVKGENFLRAGFFTPNLIGGIVLGFIWQFVFNRVFPEVLMAIPGFEQSWLSSPSKAFWAIVIVATWQQSGYMLLIYIAGFVGVPQDYIEAAEIDGATAGQITRHIRLPLMAQSFVICFFLTLTSAFKVYDLNLSLTDGGPYGTTKMAAMTIFEKAFTSHNYGLGQAESNHFLPDHIGSSYYFRWFQENVRRWKHENEYCKKRLEAIRELPKILEKQWLLCIVSTLYDSFSARDY